MRANFCLQNMNYLRLLAEREDVSRGMRNSGKDTYHDCDRRRNLGTRRQLPSERFEVGRRRKRTRVPDQVQKRGTSLPSSLFYLPFFFTT